MKRIPLTKFETMAQRLVEDSFKRLFGGRVEPLEVAARLARAMEDSQQNGRAAATYVIRLHPADYHSLMQTSPQLTDDLATYVTRLARQGELSMPVKPHIELIADKAVARHQIRVNAKHDPSDDQPTTQMRRPDLTNQEALVALKKTDAFLIIKGRHHLPLDKPLITLGRLTDNDIVLDAPAVSRRHAQIRWRFGRFVLYDLGGRGRTSVNGQTVIESVLHPGDVISLSGVKLIYGEEHVEPDKEQKPVDDTGGHTLLMPRS